MKNLGILILAVGLFLGLYSLNMNVGVDVPAREYGYGISSPAMQVANADRMSQRQNLMIFSGILSVVGAILLGFASIQPKSQVSTGPSEESPSAIEEHREFMYRLPASPSTPGSFTICPKCRHMGNGDDIACNRCGEKFH